MMQYFDTKIYNYPGGFFCLKCRNQNPPGSNFCMFCGAKIEIIPAEISIENPFGINTPTNPPQSELDKLILEEVKKDIINELNSIDNKKEIIKSYKKHKLDVPDYLIKEYKDLKRVRRLPKKAKEKYIEDKAHERLNMFGSCHYQWQIKKRVLKEKYGIDWLTPAERHPEIMYD